MSISTIAQAQQLDWLVVVYAGQHAPHYRVFEDTARSFVAAFLLSGKTAVLSKGFQPLKAKHCLVFGANVAQTSSFPAADTSIVVFNLEQLFDGSPWATPTYLALLGSVKEVWDYNGSNVEWLRTKGITALHVPLGYTPALETVQRALHEDTSEDNSPLDILFYGCINERRKSIIEQLMRKGLKVHTGNYNCFGKVRDRLLRRAALVLNVHYYHTKQLEVVRLTHLVANGALVLSEEGNDAQEQATWSEGVLFAPYEGLVDAALKWCRGSSQQEKKEQQQRAYAFARAHPQRLPC